MTVTRSALWPSLLPPSQHGQDDVNTVGARGTRVELADGRTLLCGTSGLWNVNLGYGDPGVESAMVDAMREASYLSLFRREHQWARAAADELIAFCGTERYRRVMFTTSGGSANDLAMKLARHFHAVVGQPRRKIVVGLQGSYHGLTFGAHSLTGEDLGQQTYGIDTRLVRHVPPNDLEAMRLLIERHAESIAAVVVEPVLGTGAVALTTDFIHGLLELCTRHGILVVADEVATGFGRTGPAFASEGWPRPPDLLILSKALTNGAAAASAVLLGDRIATALTDADAVIAHAETQAGTPVTCAAISAVLHRIQETDLLNRGREVATHLDLALVGLADRPWLEGVTGAGCFRGLTLRGADGGPLNPAAVPAVVRGIADAGAIVYPGPHGIQLVPSLIYTQDEVAELIARVETGILTAGAGTSMVALS